MLRKKRVMLGLVVVAFALIASACSSDSSDETLKVAFVYVGPTADKGWNWTHDQGANFVAENMDNVEITRLEAIAEGPDSQRVFEDLAADGNTLIFGNSFGYMDSMLAAAENFPDTVFMHATGFKANDTNMTNYFGAAEEARYLSGMAAGAATESNLIGYVAAFAIPEVLRGINAFALGVQEVNPDAVVRVVWTATWFDPPIEGQAAQSLLNEGADVIAMHQDSPAPGQAADEAGAFWVGYNADTSDVAPNAWLTAPTWNWGDYYLKVAEAVRDGSFDATPFYGNMAEGMVDLAPFGDAVDSDTRSLIEERKAQIIDGSFCVFGETVTDQDGNSQPIGDCNQGGYDTSEYYVNILSMIYLVAGVEGSATG